MQPLSEKEASRKVCGWWPSAGTALGRSLKRHPLSQSPLHKLLRYSVHAYKEAALAALRRELAAAERPNSAAFRALRAQSMQLTLARQFTDYQQQCQQ